MLLLQLHCESLRYVGGGGGEGGGEVGREGGPLTDCRR
jgi:hypothetical protein